VFFLLQNDCLFSVNFQVIYNFRKQAVWAPGSADMVCPRPPLTVTFDRLTLKQVR